MINKRNRKIYIDFLKIIAMYMVLFNHTGTRGFVLFTVKRDSPFFMFYLFNTIFIKIGVQLFFMSSGALLINKEESLKSVITNRFMKYLSVLIIGSLIQYVYACYKYSQVFSVSSFLTKLYTGDIAVAYWYLYTYLAFLLMLPLIRRLAKSMTISEYYWMIILYGLMNFLSIIEFLIWKGEHSHNNSFYFFISSYYLFYPLMGFFIDSKMDEKNSSRRTILRLFVATFFSIIVCCLMTIYKCTIIGEWKENSCQSFFTTLIFIPSITVFLSARCFFLKHELPEKICKVISTLGGLTFGVFLIENILREEMQKVFITLEPYIKTLPACWLWILVAYLAGFMIIAFIKCIPGVNKYI